MLVLHKIKWTFVTFIFGFLGRSEALNIAVIGAGAAGLTSAKNAIEQGHNVNIYEKTGVLGGIWYYTDKTGVDEYGVDIHTPMYRDLRTNIPYQLIEFPGYEYPEETQGYPSHTEILKYLNSYASDFNLTEHIKFHHLVDKIVSIKNNKWKITVKNMTNKKRTETKIFDAVFVCTGINSEPRKPEIEGVNKFKRISMHSHDYRIPETFSGKDVLVVGQGVSGHDIVNQLQGIAKSVLHSSYKPAPIPEISTTKKLIGKAREFCSKGFDDEEEDPPLSEKESNLVTFGNVKRFTGKNSVEFQDGTRRNISVVIYATGYKYSYPFLKKNTGIQVHDKYVYPLYKQILNIEHSTMAFIGVPYSAAHFWMYDLQARFALKYISDEIVLPPHDEMIMESKKLIVRNKPHLLGYGQRRYCTDLAKTADIEDIPGVISDLFSLAVTVKEFYDCQQNNFQQLHSMLTSRTVAIKYAFPR
ncbi:senecionine N-oxygenase-like [Contarinia nasturtii]|uniref:senecionine N-oxygenase-like n=1 Tax=Contarinia nasturtii TaxID=265458 RepID=UPI0012D485C1|nr:senecionine N-oxygenase-like [Contarinia nasturtii]